MICAGIDWSKAGWYAVILECDEAIQVQQHEAFATFSAMLEETTAAAAIAVDIPIGLSADEPRKCDLLARRHLREPRRRSVFPPPVRAALTARSHDDASAINEQHCGRKVSRQTWSILPRIREVDHAMTPELQRRVVEIHPEVCFWALNSRKAMPHRKKSVAGRKERLGVLLPIFGDQLARALGEPGRPRGVAQDDVLDAFAAAYTACMFAQDNYWRIPHHPPTDAHGLRMEMIVPCRTRSPDL